MPVAILNQTLKSGWPLGRSICDIWHAMEVCSCTASILNLSCIAYERYIATADPLQYTLRLNSRRVTVLMAIVWLCSISLSFPAIFWWRHDYNKLKTSIFLKALESSHILQNESNQRYENNDTQRLIESQMEQTCEFPDDPIYLLKFS